MTAHISRRQQKKAASEQSSARRQSKFTRIVQEQGGKCWFCGEDMGADCTREHLLAVSLGGGNERSNLRAAHSECNSAAGSLSVQDKMRLRAVGHSDGRAEMMMLARQMRRADARVAFSEEKTPKPRRSNPPRDWTSDSFSADVAAWKAGEKRVKVESGIAKTYRKTRSGKLKISYGKASP